MSLDRVHIVIKKFIVRLLRYLFKTRSASLKDKQRKKLTYNCKLRYTTSTDIEKLTSNIDRICTEIIVLNGAVYFVINMDQIVIGLR